MQKGKSALGRMRIRQQPYLLLLSRLSNIIETLSLSLMTDARLGMLTTAHCGSGRQCVTDSCRQATDTGRQIAGSRRRQVAGSGRLSMGQYKLSCLKMTENDIFKFNCFVIYF